jgi:hypothetical protein
MTIVGIKIERSREVGLVVVGGEARLESVIVRDTLPREAFGDLGRGINVQPDGNGPANVTIVSSVVERSADCGVLLLDSALTMESTAVLDTVPGGGGVLGDGIAAITEFGEAHLTVSSSRVAGSARAGISCFGAKVDLGTSTLACNAIDLNGDPSFMGGGLCSLTDSGGNACGCGDVSGPCTMLSSTLQPPPALPQ